MKAKASHPLTTIAGTSLLEIMISVAVLSLMIGAVAMVGSAGGRAYRTGATAAQLEQQSAETIEKIFAELQIAGLETLTSDPSQGLGSEKISYLVATGFEDGDVVWSPLRSLAFEYEVGELDDGVDNNGNGLVDEGTVILTENVGGPDETRRVLTRWVRELLEGEVDNGIDDNGNDLVDEKGFFVERVGETLIVRLTLERRDAEGRFLTRTSQTATRLRN